MQPLPLQVPGFMELAVIALIFIILALPVALIIGLIFWLRGRTDDATSKEATVEELEKQVAELEAQIEDLEGESTD